MADSIRLRRYLIETRHGYVHVRAAGQGGVPVVHLHYGGYSGHLYRRVLPLVGVDRLAVSLDRIGFGMSDPLPKPLPMVEIALATLDALDGLGIEAFDVVGSHTGATEAVELAAAHPGRVRKLILAGVALFDDQERQALTQYYQEASPLDYDGAHLIRIWEKTRNGGEGRHTVYRNPPEEWENPSAPGLKHRWTPEQIQNQVLHGLLAVEPSGHPGVTAGVFEYPLTERFPAVTQPVLVLNTNDDLWKITARAPELLPPHGSYVELPHLDILAFEIAPEEMADRIRAFLDSGSTALTS